MNQDSNSPKQHYCYNETRLAHVEIVAETIKEGQEDIKEGLSGVVKAIKGLELHIAAMGFGEYKQWVRDTHKETTRRLGEVEDASAQVAQDLRWMKKAMAGIWAAVVMLGSATAGAVWHLIQQVKH
jgi:hypothetical protein